MAWYSARWSGSGGIALKAVVLAAVLLAAPTTAAVKPLDFGNYTLRITTSSPAAQANFDQALGHQYGFNTKQSRESFAACAAADPQAPMCQWGLALAHGPFLNYVPIAPEDVAAGRAAAKAAVRLASQRLLSGKEASLVASMARHFPETDSGNQTASMVSYAAAMQGLVARFPQDADVLAFAAAAEMELAKLIYHGYYYTQTMDRPSGGWVPPATQAKILLERLLSDSDNKIHPFGLHLYIHLTEPGVPGALDGAAAGERAADLLAQLDLTGSGHLEHMPGHLFLRVGRYNDAVIANSRAHAADQLYFDTTRQPYGAAHNEAFGSYASAMDGQSGAAVKAALAMRPIYARGEEVTRGAPGMEVGWNLLLAQHARFANWQPIMVENNTLSPTAWPYSAVLRHYARGLAQAGTGDLSGFHAEWRQLQARMASVSPQFEQLAAVANSSLAARSALIEDRPAAAAELLETVVGMQLSWNYTEPPNWHFPFRQCLGACYLQAGAAARAEAVYRADLTQYLNNGWSLLGLAQAMAAQPDKYSPAQVGRMRAEFDTAWARADVSIESSCPMFGLKFN